jgi:SH3-like domain-containing protein
MHQQKLFGEVVALETISIRRKRSGIKQKRMAPDHDKSVLEIKRHAGRRTPVTFTRCLETRNWRRCRKKKGRTGRLHIEARIQHLRGG